MSEASLVYGYQMQHWIKVGETVYHVEELNSWDASDDDTIYEPKYLDKSTQPKYVLSTKSSVTADCDMLVPSEWHGWCAQHEGEKNIAATYYRTLNVDVATGPKLEETALAAYEVPVMVGVGALTQSDGNPIRQTFTLDMVGEKTKGTFNASTKMFTATEQA